MQIQCTTNYDMFTLMPGQRYPDISKRPRLIASFKKRGFDPTKPIVVNSKMQITDGGHRWATARYTNQPVFYVITDQLTIEDVREEAVTAKNWSVSDYLYSYCDLGNPHYITFRDIVQEFKIDTSMALMLSERILRNWRWRSKRASMQIISGDFVLTEDDKTKIVDGIKKYKELMELPIRSEVYRRRAFLCAWGFIISEPTYNHERMMRQIGKQLNKMQLRSGIESTLIMLQEIYNYQYAENLRVNFLESLRKMDKKDHSSA